MPELFFAPDWLPPGPRIAPLMSMRFVKDPYGLYRDCYQKYGDLFGGMTMFGPLMCICSPEGAREVFSAPLGTFHQWGVDAVAPLLGPKSLLLSSGEMHRRDRKLLTPPFHGKRMRAYADLILQSAQSAMSLRKPGETFELQETTQAVSLDVILRAVFGVQDKQKQAAYQQVIVALTHHLDGAALVFKALRSRLYPPWRQFLQARDEFYRMLNEEVADRRQNPTGGQDILSMMLEARYEDGDLMEDDHVVDQLVGLLIAGHETTSTALCWAVHWLLRHPECADKLRAEIAELGPNPAGEDIARLPYLTAVCNETLRMHPILPDIPRQMAKPGTICGVDLPAGAALAIGITAIHSWPDLYPEPEAFKPERFLNKKPSPFEFMPFGGGNRRCIGAALAQFEMKIVLAELFMNHRFEPASEDVAPARRHIMMAPGNGVPLRYLGLSNGVVQALELSLAIVKISL